VSRERSWCTAFVLASSLMCPVTSDAADDGLEAARRLYAAAAYEDALKTLDGFQAPTPDVGTRVALQQQRLLCLVALGRPADAEQAMTAIVQADPLYVPDAASAPPRVRAAFREVRARLVPGIAKGEYERARHAYEAADYAAASTGFARVLSIVELPDGASADPVLRDMSVLAAGFKTLSDKANVPPPAPPAAPLAPAAAAAAPVSAAPVSAAPLTGRIYDATSPGIAIPGIVRQVMPQWPRSLGPPPNREAILQIVINEDGQVESARVTRGVQKGYDQILLTAASTWSYVPAQVDGERVKFRKVIKLSFR
jgi:TonB family protein